MKRLIKFFILLFFVLIFISFSFSKEKENTKKKKEAEQKTKKEDTFEIIVTAPRVEVSLKESPGAMTVITTSILKNLPRSIGLDEVMKLVPGVRVDNQADGERVHFYIRGQGILTERGTRGIKVIVDGIPLNDPTGFVSDFYDIDWATVSKIEVLRGPAAALYGSGASGGVLNIITRDGGEEPVSVSGSFIGGSYGFYKAFTEANGTSGILNYRISGSMVSGDGYRDHSAFSGKNIYGKFTLGKGKRKLTFILSAANYYNENPEGLNLAWFSSDPHNLRKLANPDAYYFNEYQNTERYTGGLHTIFEIIKDLNLDFSAYWRHTKYREAVPSSVIHRTYETPGISMQLNYLLGKGYLKNRVSMGLDFSYQSLGEFKHPNLGAAVEGKELLSDQTINQNGLGVFFIDRLKIGDFWSISFGLRYDKIQNTLTDNLKANNIDLSSDVIFEKLTSRIGVSWNLRKEFSFYGSWGTGFLPPETEELINNPNAYGGYNRSLIPATSSGIEGGIRGVVKESLFYDIALFYLKTENDFGRYRIKSRPLETFYGNVGSSKRYGAEIMLGWFPFDALDLRLAYTYSNFKYTEVKTMDDGKIYYDTFLPNSPEHHLFVDAEYRVNNNFRLGGSLEYVSSWYIDATNRIFSNGYGKTSPYTLLSVRASYSFYLDNSRFEVFLYGRNILNKEYYGFTEPDPDGNSYQPAPTSEWSAGIRFYK